MKNKTDYKSQGKRNRVNGANFEKRVFEDLKSRDWIVSRWPNKVEFKDPKVIDICKIADNPKLKKIPMINLGMEFGKLVQAKPKWINGRILGMNSGFPDFFAFRKSSSGTVFTHNDYMIIGVECKINNILDRKEKNQLEFYLKNKIFSKIFIAYKTKEKNRVKVNYREFK